MSVSIGKVPDGHDELTLDNGSAHLRAVCAGAGCLGKPVLDVEETETREHDAGRFGYF